MSQNLHQLVYISRSQSKLKKSEIDQIGARAQDANLKNNITGILLYREGYFLQLLEGDQIDVHYTFKKIRDDQRHKITSVLVNKVVDERLFPGWNMAVRDLGDLNDDLLKKVVELFEANQVPGKTLEAIWTFYGNTKD